jgi:hypothetical protein
MQNIPGIQLAEVWPTLELPKRFEVVKKLAKFQKTFLSATFTSTGALYYSDDLQDPRSLECIFTDEHNYKMRDARFSIGPCTGREFTDYYRTLVKRDRGPCKPACRQMLGYYCLRCLGSSAEDYRVAIGRREIACVRELSELPKSPLTLRGSGAYSPTRAKKIAAIEDYIELVKCLLPTDESIKRSYLWHSDLHAENIYVDPNDPVHITGVINWQSTDILPLFDHSLQLPVLEYDGPPLKVSRTPNIPTTTRTFHLKKRTRRGISSVTCP